jgi:hypothetical protein
MGSLRFRELQTRPTEVLDLTSLTVDEFQPLVPPLEAAFQAHMAAGASMGSRAPLAATPPIRTVRCRRRRIGCCVSWCT